MKNKVVVVVVILLTIGLGTGLYLFLKKKKEKEEEGEKPQEIKPQQTEVKKTLRELVDEQNTQNLAKQAEIIQSVNNGFQKKPLIFSRKTSQNQAEPKVTNLNTPVGTVTGNTSMSDLITNPVIKPDLVINNVNVTPVSSLQNLKNLKVAV
jgi:hypothetical protein